MPRNQDEGTSAAGTSNSDILKLAEILKEVILTKQQNKNDDFDFVEKPRKYDGSRDPHIIEAWIQSIEDYADLKNLDHQKSAKLGVTLLVGAAKVWYQNLRLLNSAPVHWLELKTELRAYFKPENSTSVARDKMRNLRQTASIAQYVQEFMTIKLSIPRMTDEEAVDKFIAGLKDSAARIHIKDTIFMESPVLMDAIRVAHNYEGNRLEGVLTSRGSFAVEYDQQIDDPMDLSIAECRELFIMMKSWNASRGRDRGTNSFRGGARGGSNHGFRSRSGGQQKRGGNRANIQCHNCEGFGHYQRECASGKRSQLNYVEEGEKYNECVDDNAEDEDVDHSAYLYCGMYPKRTLRFIIKTPKSF
jgi:hypothetical protein